MLRNRQFVNGRLNEKEFISKEIMFYEEITLFNYLMHQLWRKIQMKIYYYSVELKGQTYLKSISGLQGPPHIGTIFKTLSERFHLARQLPSVGKNCATMGWIQKYVRY